MGEPRRSWPPRVSDRELDREFAEDDDREFAEDDREFPTASWPPRTASSGDREDDDDREFPAPWPRRADREDREQGTRVELAKPSRAVLRALPDDDEDDDYEPRLPAFVSPLQELRFVRDATTTADHIDYAINGAYSQSDGWWRKANIVFAYTIATVGKLIVDAITWAFFQRLSRFLIAIPTVFALAWALNHIPVTAWAIPDGWDITTWWGPDPDLTVEVPIEVPLDAPVGEG